MNEFMSSHSERQALWHPSLAKNVKELRINPEKKAELGDKKESDPSLAETVRATYAELNELIKERLNGRAEFSPTQSAEVASLLTDLKRILRMKDVGGKAVAELVQSGDIDYFEDSSAEEVRVPIQQGSKRFKLVIYANTEDRVRRISLKSIED